MPPPTSIFFKSTLAKSHLIEPGLIKPDFRWCLIDHTAHDLEGCDIGQMAIGKVPSFPICAETENAGFHR
ncbi:MAG: hypothetical protein VB959_08370, partial [Rhodospirillales bacterium]